METVAQRQQCVAPERHDHRLILNREDECRSGIDSYRRYSTSAIKQITAVPEPATWAMMIGGFGLIGGAMRRRNRSVTFA